MHSFSPKEIKAMEDEIRRLTKGEFPKDVAGPRRPDLYPLLIETLRDIEKNGPRTLADLAKPKGIAREFTHKEREALLKELTPKRTRELWKKYNLEKTPLLK